jgi:RND family efflux transporter MFP subunit
MTRAREELAKLRRGSRREEIDQRAAELGEQQAIVDRLARDHERAQKLRADEIISESELQRTESDHAAARQKLERAAAALRMAEAGSRPEEIAMAEADLEQATARAERITDEVRRTRIVAPITGHVVKRHVDVGAWVGRGDRVVDLIGLDPVFATGVVGEREIPQVRVGQPATVTLDAFPGRTFRGRVGAIVPGAEAGSRTFPVKVTVDNPGGLLKAGMFARVTVQIGQGRTGLFVPKDAVVRRGGQEYVFLVNGDAAQQVKVRVRAEMGALVEVSGDGLAAGARAITLGNEFLQPGMKVAPAP